MGSRQITVAAVIAAVAVLLTGANLRSAVSAFPPLADRIAEDLSASESFGAGLFIGLVGMAPTAMFAVAALLSGPMARRMTFRSVVVVAMTLAGVGFGLRALAGEPVVFLAGTMIGLVGVGITNTLLPAVIKDYFPFRLTLMSMAYMLVGQLSMATASAVAVPLAGRWGWRGAIAVWAVPALLAAVAWLVLVLWVTPRGQRRRLVLRPVTSTVERRRARRDSADRVVDGDTVRRGSENAALRARMWSHPASWGIVAMFAATSTMSYCFITWAPKIITSSGGSDTLGGMVGAMFAVVGAVASVVAPWASDRFRHGARGVVLVSGVSMFTALAMLLYDPMHFPMLWNALASVGCTTFPLALYLVATRTRLPSAAAELSSRAQGIGYAVACFGPFGFGYLHDRTGSWDTGLYALIVVNMILLAAGWIGSANVFVDEPRGGEQSHVEAVRA